MNNSGSWKKVLPVAEMVFFLVLLISCGVKVEPKVIESTGNKDLDLSEWSFEENGPIRITGNVWEFYWDRLYTPNDFLLNAPLEEPVLVTGGEPWNGTVVNGEKIPEDGFATYRTVLLHSKPGELYGFYIKNQDSAYRLWINGELLAENGIVAETKEDYRAQRLPRLFYYSSQSRKLEIVTQIANFTHKWGGLTNNIYMGLPDQISSFIFYKNAIVMFLAGAILIMALYHLFLFLNWKLDRAPFYFFIFCLFVFFEYLFTGNYLFFQFFPAFPLSLGIRLHYFSLFGVLPFFLHFIYAIYPRSLKRIFVLAPAVATGFLMVLALIAPVKFFGLYTLIPFYIFVVVGAVITAIVIIKALITGQSGAALSLIGFVLFILSVFYDIAANRKIITGSALTPLIPAGVFAFILFQSFILANRISRAYRRLDNLTNNLEQMVERRTAELENTRNKLFEREKLAALGTLAGGIYHEIFNPLSGISGPLSVIKKNLFSPTDTAMNEQIHRNIGYMEANVKKITDIVNNLNDLIHEKQIKKEPLKLFPLVKDVIENISSQTDKHVEFSIDIKEEDTILSEENILKQILVNLISNALDAVEKDGTIDVSFENTGTDRRLTVKDNGHGMDQEEVSRAGNPFYTTKELSGGNGLGLFLVKQYAANFGWDVSIESRKSRGTAVSIIMNDNKMA
jgi:signal transduction histidine kinase